jgi:uncharacterized membrane protein
MSQASPAADLNDTDKLMAALSYFLTPIVPAIVLLVDTMKVRPYQKYHAVQALGLFGVEVIFYILICVCTTVLSVVTLGIGACLSLLFFLPIIPNIYYAIIAYTRGTYFEIPVVTKFMIQQHWLTM